VQLEIVEDDNTIFFGLIQDLRGANRTAGIARRNATEIAVGEIHSVARGIPGGKDGKRRPIAVIACSETLNETSPSEPKLPAKHLIDDLHVPAIIGASNSETTTDLVNGETIPKKTLLFSSNAITGALTTLMDDDLFWRTAVSATVTAKAVQRAIAEQESVAVTRGATAGDVKLAFAYIGDAFGKDIAPLINAGLKINGQLITNVGTNGPLCSATPCPATSRVFFKEYAATPTAAELSALGNSIAAFAPHVALIVGRKDAVTVMKTIEATTPAFLPEYQFTQGSATGDLTAETTTTGLRARVRGTRPLAGANEPAFNLLYNTAYPQPANPPAGVGTAGVYDIVYLLTYAALAAPGDAAAELLTGKRVAEGLKKVLGGPEANVVNVGLTDINKGFNVLLTGQPIKVKGVSYNYDFDVAVGEAPNRIDIFCVSSTGNAIRPSGSVFDPFTNPPAGQLTGNFSCPAQ